MGRSLTCGAALAAALAAGGCSFSYKLDSLFGSDDAKPKLSQPASVPATQAVPSGKVARADLPPAAADAELPTGSIRPAAPAAPHAPGAVSAAAKPMPPERDLAYARAAASEAVARESLSASIPWENPQTGARGTVTALAAAYNEGGFVCRDFLASYVHGANEAWLQGEACRMHQGKWEVRKLRPWSRT